MTGDGQPDPKPRKVKKFEGSRKPRKGIPRGNRSRKGQGRGRKGI